MGDCEYSRTLELFGDQLLDGLFSHDVDVCSGLIKYHDLIVLQDGPHNAQKLFLSDSEIAAVFCDLVAEASLFILRLRSWSLAWSDLRRSFFFLLLLIIWGLLFLEEIFKFGSAEEFNDAFVTGCIERVKVVSE